MTQKNEPVIRDLYAAKRALDVKIAGEILLLQRIDPLDFPSIAAGHRVYIDRLRAARDHADAQVKNGHATLALITYSNAK